MPTGVTNCCAAFVRCNFQHFHAASSCASRYIALVWAKKVQPNSPIGPNSWWHLPNVGFLCIDMDSLDNSRRTLTNVSYSTLGNKKLIVRVSAVLAGETWLNRCGPEFLKAPDGHGIYTTLFVKMKANIRIYHV